MLQSGMQLEQGHKLEQNLSQQMIHSLEILQLPTLELEARIRTELESNPLLELEEHSSSDEIDGGEFDSNEDDFSDNEVDWENFAEQQSDERVSRSERPNDLPPLEIPYSEGVEEQLLAQLGELSLSPEVAEVGRYLIRNLDDDGWLRCEGETGLQKEPHSSFWMEEIDRLAAGEIEIEEASQLVQSALRAVQSLDPAGVGARSLRESLLLQLERLPHSSSLAAAIVRDSFDLLEKRLVPALAKRYELEPAQIQEALEEIAQLNPYPARLLDRRPAMDAIPDAAVYWRQGRAQITLNDGNLPQLQINASYRQLLQRQSGATAVEKEYLRDRLTKAQWLINAVTQRKMTMLKVIQSIVKRQASFFEEGPSKLKPMILQDIADEIGMHLSTVNRVTNGKYLQTDHGLFELKELFTSGVEQQDGTEESSSAIQQHIAALIAAENPSKPLSDQALCDLLGKEGVRVARRTVTKYREQLGISVARMRKRF